MLARSLLTALCFLGCARSAGEGERSSGHGAEHATLEETRAAAVAPPDPDEHDTHPSEEGALADGDEDALSGADEAHRVELVEADGEDLIEADGEDLVEADGEDLVEPAGDEAGWAERLGPDSTLCADAEPSLRVLMPSVFEDTPSAVQDTPDLEHSEAAPPE